MNEGRYAASIRAALESVVDGAADGPQWHELGVHQLTPPRRRHAALVVISTMAAVLFVVGGALVLLNPTSTGPNGSESPVVSDTPVVSVADQQPAPSTPNLEIDAPEGVFVITHLRAVVTGRVDPGTEVTVGGVAATINESATDAPLSATFEHEFWLELGDNTVVVTATGPGGTTTKTMQPIVLPSARTQIGYITDVTALQIELDSAEIVRADDAETRVKPPTLTMLGTVGNDPGEHIIINPTADTETLRLDSKVHVILLASTPGGPVEVVVPFASWKAMWTGDEDDSAYNNAASPSTPYWVTIHDGAVFQIQQQSPGDDTGVTQPTTSVTQAPDSESTATGPLFGEPVGVVLLFDDGIDGVLAVDPDEGVGSRSVIEGQAAGDQPYRLTRVDNHFVVGWGPVYAADVATRESTLLGSATIYVPAVEPGLVWLVSYPSGRIQGTPTVWQANMTGDQVTEPTAIEEDGFPAIGIAGGLALETDDGVAIWDAATGTIEQRLGTGSGFVSDAMGDLVAWCDVCSELHITDLGNGDDLTIAAPGDGGGFPRRPFGARAARFSPDGEFLAALAGSSVVLIDTTTGEADVVAEVPTNDAGYFVGWSPDGTQLFVTSYSYGQSSTTLLRYHLEADTVDVVTLPFGGALSFIVVEPTDAAPYLRDEDQESNSCPPVNTQPSGRTGICGFRF